ncbi:acetyl-CoA acetyltransferase [Sphingomonas fennica]|uniref:Acetyl-CoA acetyltransferase n=1 Tax=Edaphosphingomonas fennica TaxID=114404 RepID=A0A2T4I896_9SPHN|nr:acetyl-CoA acetyltransferase [Sphingomonas fennica]
MSPTTRRRSTSCAVPRSFSSTRTTREAGAEALADAGIDGSQVDAVWLGHFNSGLVPDGFCSSMAIGIDEALRFKPAIRCENACASGAAAVYSALDAVRSGRVRTALVIGAEKMSSRDTVGVAQALSGAAYQPEEAQMSFPDIFARFAQAYGERFGSPVEAMARIAVKNHGNALSNPLAQLHKPLDLDFCLEPSERNPMISPPLKVTDCSLISDGAAAIVITRADMVGDFRRAVRFLAAEQVNDVLPLSRKELADFAGPRLAFRKAYAAAGVRLEDIDFAEVHDCFTIAELLTVEAMGLAEQGQGAHVIREGQTERGGRLPVNLSGGLKAKGHPVGATGVSMHALVTRQLTGRAGDIQLPDARLGLCFNMGGGAVVSCVSILETLKL